MSPISRAPLQIAIGIVFLLAGLTKLRHPAVFKKAIVEFDILPRYLAHPTAILILIAELSIGLGHLTDRYLHVAVLVGLAILSVFGIAVFASLARKRKHSCHCFGDSSEPVSFYTLIRLFLLGAAELSLLHIDPQLRLPSLGAVPLGLAAFWAAFDIWVALWLLSISRLIRIFRGSQAFN